MLLIDCVYCGPRAEIEFRCGGESHIRRPGPHDLVSDAEWADYLFYRENPKGEHRERWFHAAGCRRWFNAARDTVTHRIRVTYKMTDLCPAPDDLPSSTKSQGVSSAADSCPAEGEAA